MLDAVFANFTVFFDGMFFELLPPTMIFLVFRILNIEKRRIFMKCWFVASVMVMFAMVGCGFGNQTSSVKDQSSEDYERSHAGMFYCKNDNTNAVTLKLLNFNFMFEGENNGEGHWYAFTDNSQIVAQRVEDKIILKDTNSNRTLELGKVRFNTDSEPCPNAENKKFYGSVIIDQRIIKTGGYYKDKAHPSCTTYSKGPFIPTSPVATIMKRRMGTFTIELTNGSTKMNLEQDFWREFHLDSCIPFATCPAMKLAYKFKTTACEENPAPFVLPKDIGVSFNDDINSPAE